MGKKDSLRIDLLRLRLPTDAVTVFDVITETKVTQP